MTEILLNLHMHSVYSDGHETHAGIAQHAIHAGLDAIIITDHNVWAGGQERYYEEGGKKVLLLVGEEVHDPLREPQKNHLLAFGANRELAPFGENPQILIDQINQSNGFAFIAHPVDPALPLFGEDDLSWVDWQVQNYTGIELWNGFSEFKSRIHSRLQAIYFAYFPETIPLGPLPETIKRWDSLLNSGNKVVAIGGSDAHAIPMRLGPLRRVVFPYEYHFRAVNTHVMTPQELQGDFQADKQMILEALRDGHAFIANDLPAPARGFRFTAQSWDQKVSMGDEIILRGGVTFQIRLPLRAECSLVRDGKVIKTWKDREIISYITTEPGVYRVEVHIHYRGERRGWIFSNPIYLQSEA